MDDILRLEAVPCPTTHQRPLIHVLPAITFLTERTVALPSCSFSFQHPFSPDLFWPKHVLYVFFTFSACALEREGTLGLGVFARQDQVGRCWEGGAYHPRTTCAFASTCAGTTVISIAHRIPHGLSRLIVSAGGGLGERPFVGGV
jgi:hypothetical protein